MSAPVPKLDDTLGCMLIGVLFTTFLQGLLTIQLYNYYDRCRGDSLGLKALVLGVWLLDTVHLISVSHGLYHYTVTEWGNPPALALSTWKLDINVVVTCLSSFLCQAFFLRRVFVLSNKNWFIVLVPFLAGLGSLISGIIITVKIIQIPAFSSWASTTAESVGMYGLTAASDTMLALLLCFYLSRVETQFKRTQTMIRKVIKYAIATGLFTSIVAVVSLILFIVKANSFVFFTTYFSLPSLYTNSLLANLNSRQSLARPSGEDQPLDLSEISTTRRKHTHSEPIRVMVNTTTIDDYSSDASRKDEPEDGSKV